MVIAIDGPAGVGKSTIARCLARRTGFKYLVSGDLYRAITYGILVRGIDPADENLVIESIGTFDITIAADRVFLNGQDIQDHLHTDTVDRWVAQVSAIVPVRKIVNALLRKIAEGADVIVDGRDITTVVFPDAECKFYLDASVEMRAKRRFAQGLSSLTLEEQMRAIEKRDAIDRNKPVGSLKLASDANYLDTSDLTIDEVCEKVLRAIPRKETKNA